MLMSGGNFPLFLLHGRPWNFCSWRDVESSLPGISVSSYIQHYSFFSTLFPYSHFCCFYFNCLCCIVRSMFSLFPPFNFKFSFLYQTKFSQIYIEKFSIYFTDQPFLFPFNKRPRKTKTDKTLVEVKSLGGYLCKQVPFSASLLPFTPIRHPFTYPWLKKIPRNTNHNKQTQNLRSSKM